MSMHWQDARDPSGRWLGLEFTVSQRPRPSWRIEAAPPCLRLAREGRPLLWARRFPGYSQGIQWLLGSEEESSPLPPLRAREVDSVHEAPLSEPWFANWARHFARALESSPASPLHEGTWRLKRVFPFSNSGEGRAPPDEPPWQLVHGVTRYPRQPFAEHVEWGIGHDSQLIGLRHPSRLSPSRLEVWRKRAREGTLPPVLILNVSPLEGFVALDGHHRWMAALEEQRPVPLLTLESVGPGRYISASPEAQRRIERIYQQHAADGGSSRLERNSPRPIPVERLNELALDAWNDRPGIYPYTRGWPIPGGRQTWSQEVRARLAELGSAVSPELREAMLDGL